MDERRSSNINVVQIEWLLITDFISFYIIHGGVSLNDRYPGLYYYHYYYYYSTNRCDDDERLKKAKQSEEDSTETDHKKREKKKEL